MKQFAIMLGCVFALTGIAAASNVDSVRTAGGILMLPPGARAEALGGCGTLLGEAYSGLYNPGAQVLMDDLAGCIYYNPRPNFLKGREFVALSAAAHTDFGYTGFYYLTRSGISNSNDASLRPEQASALLISGRAWKNLGVGLGLKILITQKNQFVNLAGPITKDYKMAFDFGAVYGGLFPQATLSRVDSEDDPYHERFGRKSLSGISIGAAFQNMGGNVEYNEITRLPLPQTFRADVMWVAFRNRWTDVYLYGQQQKILVRRDPYPGGFRDAGNALFHAWSSGDLQGSWISRLGVEAIVFSLASVRVGWSVDHGAEQSFNHLGLGLGPQWLQANLACVHQPGSEFSWWDGFRMDLSANLTYEKIRLWMNK